MHYPHYTHLFQDVNWQEQWETFAPHFYDGLAHIDLRCGTGNPTTLLLKPGAGFGDLSHPTTRLATSLMTPLVKENKNQVVFDIGCGSGILSIAAALLGAGQVFGTDIDEKAIQHSLDNAEINQVTLKTTFAKELDPRWIPQKPVTILMNMIHSEQLTAWGSLGPLHGVKAHIVTSGLLLEGKEAYLKLTQSWGWTPLVEVEEEGWLGFVFSQGFSI